MRHGRDPRRRDRAPNPGQESDLVPAGDFADAQVPAARVQGRPGHLQRVRTRSEDQLQPQAGGDRELLRTREDQEAGQDAVRRERPGVPPQEPPGGVPAAPAPRGGGGRERAVAHGPRHAPQEDAAPGLQQAELPQPARRAAGRGDGGAGARAGGAGAGEADPAGAHGEGPHSEGPGGQNQREAGRGGGVRVGTRHLQHPHRLQVGAGTRREDPRPPAGLLAACEDFPGGCAQGLLAHSLTLSQLSARGSQSRADS